MKALSIGLSIIAILLIGLFIGYLLWGPTWELPQEFSYDRYDVLKDTLTIVLAVIAIVVAVLGVVVYRFVHLTLERERETFERQTMQLIDVEARRWRARSLTNIGYSLWKLGVLDEAIRFTREAHDVHARGLDEKEPENQELIGTIRNNLASYFSQTRQEKDLARGYASYIHSISHKFPKHREIWEKTYKEVLEAFPDE